MDGSGLKPSEAVILALRELDEHQGSPAKSIQYYLMGKYGLDSHQARLLVSLGLKRGILDGVLVRHNGLYSLRQLDEFNIAGRLRSGRHFRSAVAGANHRNRRQRAS